MRFSRSAGYTLIELAVAITIIGAIASISMIKFGQSLAGWRMRSAASVLATDVQRVPAVAARDGVPVQLVLHDGALGYDLQTRNADTVYATRNMGSTGDYRLDTFTATANTLEFLPNGIPTASVTYTLTLGEREREVRVSAAGQIRVSTP